MCGWDILSSRGGATNWPHRDVWENGATNRRHQWTMHGSHNAVESDEIQFEHLLVVCWKTFGGIDFSDKFHPADCL